MASKIKRLIDEMNTNPHAVSRKAGLTYRIVLELYNADQVKPSTPIGTLVKIANVLEVPVTDLFEVKAINSNSVKTVA